jgi:hypothetical protein
MVGRWIVGAVGGRRLKRKRRAIGIRNALRLHDLSLMGQVFRVLETRSCKFSF